MFIQYFIFALNFDDGKSNSNSIRASAKKCEPTRIAEKWMNEYISEIGASLTYIQLCLEHYMGPKRENRYFTVDARILQQRKFTYILLINFLANITFCHWNEEWCDVSVCASRYVLPFLSRQITVFHRLFGNFSQMHTI